MRPMSREIARAAALLLALGASVLAAGCGGQLHPTLRVAGRAQTVFKWSSDRCGDADFADLAVRAFRDSSGRIQLVLPHFVNRRLIGPDFDHLAHPCAAIMSSDGNPRPDAFDDREWIASVYTLNGRTVFALVHDEYQGNRHPGRCPSHVYRNCWYNSVTLAVSRDSGAHFAHVPPPRQLVASVPYRYVPHGGPIGMFAPSNIVRRDSHFYALAQVIGRGGSPRGTCVLRTRNLAEPGSWRAWDGSAYRMRFENPYLARGREPRQSVCRPVSQAEISQMHESLTYNTLFKRFLLVDQSRATDPATHKTVWGVYFSLSDDLVHWRPRQLLMAATTAESYKCGDAQPIAYPAIIDPSSTSRNFETSGERAYLYFTRFNYSKCRRTTDRDLLRVPIKFSE